MAATGRFENLENCKICDAKITGSSKFHYCTTQTQIRALLMEPLSFLQIVNGCRRCKSAVTNEIDEYINDFYDGKLFREEYSEMMRNWDEEKELHIFYLLY